MRRRNRIQTVAEIAPLLTCSATSGGNGSDCGDDRCAGRCCIGERWPQAFLVFSGLSVLTVLHMILNERAYAKRPSSMR